LDLKSKQVSEFKETEIGKIPTDWKVDRIENFLSPEKGSIKIGPFGSQIKREFFVPDGFKVYGQENIFKNDFSLGSRYITNERFEMLSSCELKPNDLIISMMGTIGFMVIVPKNIQKGIMDSHLLRIRIDESRVYNKFLLYALRSTVIQNQIESFSVGTIMPGLNSKIIKQLFFPIPSLSEQQRITKTLLDLDTKIENLQNQNHTLEQMAQVIFKSWFVDFDGVTEWDDSELGTIPKGWSVVNISDIIEINPTRNLKKGILAPYLGMTDIPIHSSRISGFYLREFTSGMKFINGDTLVARITPSLENGKTAFVDFLQNDEIGWGSTEYIVLRPKVPIPAEYGYCFARTDDFRSHAILNMTGTSGRQRVPESCFDEYSVVKPPTDLTTVFGNITKKIFLKIKNNANMILDLTKTRDTLLPKLMSGEIRV
jgi:type I restriction enzyme, S subunit